MLCFSISLLARTNSDHSQHHSGAGAAAAANRCIFSTCMERRLVPLLHVLTCPWRNFISLRNFFPFSCTTFLYFVEIGRRLEQVSGDARERCFLFQHLSISDSTLWRFDRGSLLAQSDLDIR